MKIILADDAAFLRQAIAELLERAGHQIICQANDAPELLAAVEAAQADNNPPDLIITDVRMPPNLTDDGLQAALKIRRKYPKIALVMLSQYVAPAYAAPLIQEALPGTSGSDALKGGVGYLLKDRVSCVSDFLNSLEMVWHGSVIIDPLVAAKLLQQHSNVLTALTPREYEVLDLMARGLSNEQIMQTLVLSSAAVSKHVANVFMKLGLGPDEPNRRVRAVLTFLTETGDPTGNR